ncbi:MAG: hypothetical protein ACPG7F_14570 [Aggregatilineales bacterium]
MTILTIMALWILTSLPIALLVGHFLSLSDETIQNPVYVSAIVDVVYEKPVQVQL